MYMYKEDGNEKSSEISGHLAKLRIGGLSVELQRVR